MSDRTIVATLDPALSARVVSCRELRYSAGPDASLDRPGHVRAGSGVAWLGDALAVVQDDASFVALVRGDEVSAVPLPADARGLRLFDVSRDNKRDKLDLESVLAFDDGGVPTLLAFGSGSTERRERVAFVTAAEGHLVEAPALYAALRARTDFAGSELNVEGAVRLGETLRLFSRGNGSIEDGRAPLDATCELDWRGVLAHLRGGAALPPIERVVSYDLGRVDGVRLTFTDATPWDEGRVLYLAGAEASPNTVDDGEMRGAALGVLGDRSARYTLIRGMDGVPLRVKAEGVVRDPRDPSRVWVVIDPDDHEKPTELCEIVVDGLR